MPSALAGLASLLWGCSDFLGGLAAKDVGAQRAGAIAQFVGLVILAGVLVVAPAHPTPHDLIWGAAAGAAGGIGIAMLYRSLATGPMAAAAPTTAVVGAAVQTAIGFGLGERPHALALVGVLLAITSVALLGFTSSEGAVRVPAATILLATGAGLALGSANASFAQTSVHSGLWPLGAAKLAASLILGAFLLAPGRGSSSRPSHGIRLAVAAGAADSGATIAIVLALQRGSLILVGVLGALFPLVTVLLARFALNERMGRAQVIGVGFAVVAVTMISVP